MPVIRTRQLTRYYPAVRSDPVKAVDSVDLELAAGEMAVVLGPSASGKTTLLGLIAGLDRPSSGSVELFGRPLADLSDAALALLRRARVGLVFQDFKLLPGLASWENVALPLVPAGTPLRDRKRRAAEWLERLGVAEVADRPPEQLSGGQQQRVALARAMVNEPDLVLADEPVSQVDPESAAKILSALEAMVAQGKTVIITTHDPTLAISCTRRFQHDSGAVGAARMIVNKYSILMLFMAGLGLALAGVLAATALWAAWRIRGSRGEQEASGAERSMHLATLVAVVCLAILVIGWPLFYAMLDSFVPEIPGAMCIYGVTRVMPVATALIQAATPAVIFILGAWLLLEHVRRQSGLARATVSRDAGSGPGRRPGGLRPRRRSLLRLQHELAQGGFLLLRPG